jgi:chromate reductase, NAD(P)H dehydrogenase (quinone)
LSHSILAFAASNSARSINRQLVTWAAHQVSDAELTLLNLNDFDVPIFSVDLEDATGIPEAAYRFRAHLHQADGIMISLAEHNGSYCAAFKNLFDWSSRIKGSMFSECPMFLMATSPGTRGGQSVLNAASARFPFMGGQVVAQLSLPSFEDHFSVDAGIIEPTLVSRFKEQLKLFEDTLKEA